MEIPTLRPSLSRRFSSFLRTSCSQLFTDDQEENLDVLIKDALLIFDDTENGNINLADDKVIIDNNNDVSSSTGNTKNDFIPNGTMIININNTDDLIDGEFDFGNFSRTSSKASSFGVAKNGGVDRSISL
eukprot:CAMPEP_0171299266 /NCGR_PEP_ID=MMETSP0816-20121228/8076_1 /TAXON_ID=420281 /ORGANISM="Proboscia inermis, Strain CCAP1064/1" /LENGTH=129 /DNA_ID=CAMNT_0011774931 /DNA_START=324 /DNA_END=713 /DNA_ORIENTATION=-